MPSSLQSLWRTPILDRGGQPSWPWIKWFQQLELEIRNALGSIRLAKNVAANYSNNATVDSIDIGNSTAQIRVYGPGGVGTTWHQTIGSISSPEIPAFTGNFAYLTNYWIYFDATNNYHVATSGFDTLPDGLIFAGTLKTVGVGGLGGSTGGGGSKYQSGGNQR